MIRNAINEIDLRKRRIRYRVKNANLFDFIVLVNRLVFKQYLTIVRKHSKFLIPVDNTRNYLKILQLQSKCLVASNFHSPNYSSAIYRQFGNYKSPNEPNESSLTLLLSINWKFHNFESNFWKSFICPDNSEARRSEILQPCAPWHQSSVQSYLKSPLPSKSPLTV